MMRRTSPKKDTGGALTDDVVARLKKLGSKSVRDGMLRYGIPNKNAFGVSVGKIQKLSKELGHNHELALALWETGFYEARMLAAFVDDPKLVTPAQMDRWCKDFDNWGIVDTVCFKLFDVTPHAWKKVEQWSKRRDEFQRRAAYALLACLGVHDKQATNEKFIACFPLIEAAATDERNFVKKGVSWALRVIGRRNLELNNAATELAQRLADSLDPTSRWLGKEALREFKRPVVRRQLENKLKKKMKSEAA
ncbi:MAG TPA: DNA alkylation repair protein [Pyrinomonadaceae bacterium]|nr:DNA alkylation repair protein [Pyrinomonadaceae bacterium]